MCVKRNGTKITKNICIAHIYDKFAVPLDNQNISAPLIVQAKIIVFGLKDVNLVANTYSLYKTLYEEWTDPQIFGWYFESYVERIKITKKSYIFLYLFILTKNYLLYRSIFQTFWKIHSCTYFLSFKLEACLLCTVWDRVPKEDAANFESDTFLWFTYVVNISKIETFLGRFWIFG